jgi:hypothetical protein
MSKKWIRTIFGISFLSLLAIAGTGCGGGCGDGETEVCGVLQTFGKNGFIDDCVCIETECLNNADCESGFFCDGGVCVAE